MLRALALDRNLVRWTGFSAVVWLRFTAAGRPYQHTLALTTIGSLTGALRSVALPYWDIDGELVVCGTNGGSPNDPRWVGNIRRNSACWVDVHRRHIPATARIADASERSALFARIEPYHPDLSRYQEQASSFGRCVPFVVVTPRR